MAFGVVGDVCVSNCTVESSRSPGRGFCRSQQYSQGGTSIVTLF